MNPGAEFNATTGFSNPSEGVKSGQWINLEGWVDWRSFRAPPLEIEALYDITP